MDGSRVQNRQPGSVDEHCGYTPANCSWGDACADCRPAPSPTWQCEFCGRFYSERTAKDHAYCIQAEDRRNAERAGAFDV
jgi:hypothetical protein